MDPEVRGLGDIGLGRPKPAKDTLPTRNVLTRVLPNRPCGNSAYYVCLEIPCYDMDIPDVQSGGVVQWYALKYKKGQWLFDTEQTSLEEMTVFRFFFPENSRQIANLSGNVRAIMWGTNIHPDIADSSPLP